MNILILGSEGFIGSNAVEYFSNQGHAVFSADVLLNVQKENYFLLDPVHPDFDTIFDTRDIELCINCSGAANVQLSFSHPLLDYKLNTLNVYKILTSILNHKPECKFINLSSAAVYGNPNKFPINEKIPAHPISPYGYHKLYSENICNQFYNLYNLKTVSLRVFSAYGPRLRKQLFWDMYKKFVSDESVVKLFGTGDETRDFIYIDDLILAIDLIAKSASFQSEAINIASGTETKIREAALIFSNYFPIKKEIKFVRSEKAGDPSKWNADISLLKSFTFTPSINLETGIQKYIQWLQTERI